MKKLTFAAVALLLCVLILLGILIGPAVGNESAVSPSVSSEIPEELTSVTSAEEPNTNNDALAMIDLSVDLYRLPADTANDVSPYFSSWQAFCEALDHQDSSFTFKSSEEKAVLLNASKQLIHAGWFTTNGTGLEVSLTYVESYEENYSFLKAIAESIIRENVYADATQLEIALLLYSYLVANVEPTDKQTTACDVLNEYCGNETAVSSAMVFLLAQFDIPASLVYGDKGVFLAAQINEQCLYFAPATEISGEYLRGLSFFAMDTETAAAACGEFEPPYFAENSTACTLAQIFVGCTDWRLDAVNHYLYLAYDSSEFTGAIATDNLSAANG